MPDKKSSVALRAVLAIFAVAAFASNTCTAKVLHNFAPKQLGGAEPLAGLVFDAAGNLYGTTKFGGASNDGTVFELIPNADGTWTQKVLHSFRGPDGCGPLAGLIFDAIGNLYGTTEGCGPKRAGIVFELVPNADGTWTEKILRSFFADSKGGWEPVAGLVFDAAGNLYGTTLLGGSVAAELGTVFELMPNADGSWKYKVLHRFNVDGKHGYYPYAGVVLDPAGNVYGTTYDGQRSGGGGVGLGTVFELMPTVSGTWNFKILHKFKNDGKDGFSPKDGLVIDTAGNLYGTTSGGSSSGLGTVFELMPNADGTWTEKILHKFKGQPDGQGPLAGLTFDAAGNLYGTTSAGGAFGVGTVFELMPNANGTWTETILHQFKNDGKDGTFPQTDVILDPIGNVYGTTGSGGVHNGGTVFEVIP